MLKESIDNTPEWFGGWHEYVTDLLLIGWVRLMPLIQRRNCVTPSLISLNDHCCIYSKADWSREPHIDVENFRLPEGGGCSVYTTALAEMLLRAGVQLFFCSSSASGQQKLDRYTQIASPCKCPLHVYSSDQIICFSVYCGLLLAGGIRCQIVRGWTYACT